MKPRPYKLCKHCGKQITGPPSRIAKVLSCSNECRYAHAHQQKKCLECDNTFRCATAEIKRSGGKFCTAKCYHINHKKKRLRLEKAIGWKGHSRDYNCIICNKPFISRWTKVQGWQNHCSRSCAKITAARKREGSRNGRWNGGTSKEPYPIAWNHRLRQSIRKRDDNTCQVCHKHQSQLKRKLDVHHIDYNKSNLADSNLVSLCTSCHTKTNKHRDKWIWFFTFRSA